MNNAGVDASGKKVAELPTELWDKAIRTNVYGYFFCCRRFAQLRTSAGGGGKIINVTSVHEDVPNVGGADYDCSKGAIRMLTRTLALELRAHQGQRERPRPRHGADALKPGGHRRPGPARRAGAEHSVEARRGAHGDRTPRAVPRVLGRRLRHGVRPT
jgi:NAD(P)-dependent dehydrogenase (short-subunit alcohol dehydrogenase family)